MKNNKYEFINQTITNGCITLRRIVAARNFGAVKVGERGGFIEREANLSHDGNCWVSGEAWVAGNASVSGDAQVYGDAYVFGDALVSGSARVHGDAKVGWGMVLTTGDYIDIDHKEPQLSEVEQLRQEIKDLKEKLNQFFPQLKV